MIGTQISSVTPGYTVDSNTTIVPGVRFCPTVLDAPSTGLRSGVLSLLTGVGTATIINFASFNLEGSAVKSTVVFLIASPTSFVASIPLLYSLTLFSLISNPITLTCFANSTAIGIPTYPNPTNASFSLPEISPE